MLQRPALAAVIASILLLPAARAADGAPSAAELVRRLGEASFAERERASEALRNLGSDAVAALEAGLKSPDAEVRRRAADLLPLARRSERDILLDEFIAGHPGERLVLPGWERFRKLAGDDLPARRYYVTLLRGEPALLETLEKDVNGPGGQLAERSRRFMSRGAAPGPAAASDETGINALLLVAACSSDKNSQAALQFQNCLFRPNFRNAIRQNAAAGRLVTLFLAKQLDQPWRLQQSVWLARNLALDDFLETTLKPEARKQAAAAAARPREPGPLYQSAMLANTLGLYDTIEGTLKPAARQLADAVAEKPDDPARLSQVVNILQTLQMQDVVDSTVRPAACQAIAATVDKPYDQYRFHMALNLARSLKLEDAIERILKPAAVKGLIKLCEQLPRHQAHLYEALNLVQTFDLKDASEDFLKPAVRRMAVAAAESGDLTRLGMATHAATSLGMTEAMEHTLRPAVKKLATQATDDPNQLTQLVNVAQTLELKQTIDTVVKPRVSRALVVAKDKPIDASAQQFLQLARTLQLKEGVPLALKASATKSLNAWARSSAVLFVADFGGKEDIPRLEALLTDSTSIGSIGLNFGTIHAELRDVALATMISLSGQSLADYDYPYLKMFGGALGPLSSMSAHCFGFTDNNGREAALRKWRERATAKR
jgi:hypothetical protein